MATPMSGVVMVVANPGAGGRFALVGVVGTADVAALKTALASSCEDIVIDLGEAEHVGGAVWQLLLAFHRTGVTAGRRLTLVSVPPPLERSLATLGFDAWAPRP